MQIKIDTTKDNPLLKRREVGFTIVSGPKEKTPPRLEVKKAVAAELALGADVVYIKHMRTKTGTSITQGVANVYQSVAQAKLVEPEYIQKRNNPKEKSTEEATA
ncbi:30S ribosomal protein S24e [Candidatus Bathycorpusculum sp.]|jgi:ribosomal protein S24E|uniref:30S ribosomal protein S24e n=1 Tax=Candidatus Bathycorpusculum sp. TaxID=2994959 RepID=UPI00282AD580|nr:30S ribosomal protein S24e [Candidatus Termitimicrobium sp.]MCL2431260.1 30S ribosomal protein S24e [Candidatus Termitimicrobium sp.]